MNVFLGVCAGVVASVMLLVLFNWIEMQNPEMDRRKHNAHCDCGECMKRALKEEKWGS